jgi:ABC-type nickel/cobalt efflux system permease component RcnA
MPDWILALLSSVQRTTVASLAAELRAGGLSTVALAFFLGAVHALTPGHGKTALAAFFLGQQSRIATGLRVSLSAAFLHVLMGFAAFIVLRLIVGQLPAVGGRGSPLFTVGGYGLIVLAGLFMIGLSLRRQASEAQPHLLTLGIGLLPCPLTISVLGFAWAQGSGTMIALVLLALAAGIAFTIGLVALLAILGRRAFGRALVDRLPRYERGARVLQGMAGAIIVAIAAWAIWSRI